MPNIATPIPGGRVSISGDFSNEEADSIVRKLKQR